MSETPYHDPRPKTPDPVNGQKGASQERYAEDILNSMSAHVAVLGPDGRIRNVNRAWQHFAQQNAPAGAVPRFTDVGVDYLGLCRACNGANADEAKPAAEGIEDVLRGRRPFFVLEYPCDSPTESRWFAMQVTPLNSDGGGVVVAHYDITARKQAEQAVAILNRRTELALTAAHMGVWILDLTTGQVDWSAEVYKIVGVTEFDGRLESWNRLVHPDDLLRMQAWSAEVIQGRTTSPGEFRVVRPSGEVRWLANVAEVETDPTGKPLFLIGTVRDVTVRKRSEWAVAAYNQILEMIAAGAALPAILDEVVRLVEEQLPGSLCSVLIVDPAANCLRVGAGRSLPAEYNLAVDGVPIGPQAGSCGTAAYRKAAVTVTDIATDPLWDDYRAVALRHGLRSCVSVPILSSGKVPGLDKGAVLATFALYNRTPGDFDRVTYAVLTGMREPTGLNLADPEVLPAESTWIIRATHLVGMAIEREHASHAIRESESRFRAVIDSAPSAIYVKDLDGRFLFVNRATAQLFGVPAHEWVGKRVRDLLPSHIADLCEASDRAVMITRQRVDERHTTLMADGREVTVLATHLLLQHSLGRFGVCGILRDITELVAAQREFERLWQYAPEPLCVAGFDGYLKRVNPAWTRLLGWSEAELLGRPSADFIHPDDREQTAEVSRELATGIPVHRFVNRYRCVDGSYRWLSWEAIRLPEAEGVYGFARDVTDERRLEAQFQQAQKMEAVGRLASGVAHDFNNLLTVINGYADLLLGRMPAADPLRDPLNQVLDAGQRATQLTSQLLAFSRRAIIEPKVLDVNRVVESSARLLRRLIGEDVVLRTDLAPVPMVVMDPGQLEQVFMNLAVNARDAMPQGGQLTIATRVMTSGDSPLSMPGAGAPGAWVRVSVTDTGAGMTADVRARIFEPFFTTKGPGKGTGLGLATVYGIVQQAGGAVDVESEPGAGTRFHIHLPATDSTAVSPPPADHSQATGGSETILIAEDEAGVRSILRMALELQGYTVLAAANGDEAIQVLASHPGRIDLLLTDVVMPDVGGRAVADAARIRRPGIRVLYMSGYTDDAVIRSGVGSAREWFIRKPFTPLVLARRVRDILDGPTDGFARP